MEDSSDGSFRRLGVMGGTFDPPHIGHLVAASEAAYAFDLDRVVLVPAGRPWQKPSYSDPEDRFLMAALATSRHPAFAASRIELDRPGLTYTVDTMQALREFHGDLTQLFFIVGADAVTKLGTWHEVERLANLAELIAVSRPRFSLAGWAAQAGWPVVHHLDIPGVDVSASQIRDRVRAGRPIDFLVPDEVASYIRDHALYIGAKEAAGG